MFGFPSRPRLRVVNYETVQYTGGRRSVRLQGRWRERKNVSVTGNATCFIRDHFHEIEVLIKEDISYSNDRSEGERLRRATLKALREKYPRHRVRFVRLKK